MKVTLREKKLLQGKRSLYLDFYPPIQVDGKQTRREFLSLYVFEKPRNEIEREHNKETKILAQSICSKRQLELQANPHGFVSSRQRKGDFLAFLKAHIAERENNSQSNQEYWQMVYFYFSDYCNGSCTFAQLNAEFLEKFRSYLLSCETYKFRNRKTDRGKSEKRTLSPNTAKEFLERIITVVKKAHRKGFISVDPTDEVTRIKRQTPKREFLLLEELKTLAATSCETLPDSIRRAALFSALTGLRYSDIKNLTWGSVRESRERGFFLSFRIKKTGEQLVLPISDEARALLGGSGAAAEKVFPDLKRVSNANYHLPKWTKAAGIERAISFHAFRRTFATAQISEGTDLYTVQKMLGHSNSRQTQIYAHLVDEKKREAANKISLK